MAWNNGFPATYQQTFPQGYPMTQNAAYAQQMAQAAYQQPSMTPPMQQMPQQQAPQMMTPPTIRAEIIQIEDEAAVDRFPLAAGASQMFMTRAEDKIIIKTMGQDGALPLVIYDKRPPAPPAPKFDPREFVRKDEFNERLNAILDVLEANQKEQPNQAAQNAPRRAAKKEDE